jgi:hypothetical protein
MCEEKEDFVFGNTVTSVHVEKEDFVFGNTVTSVHMEKEDLIDKKICKSVGNH